jgi:hypothetical protein
MLLLQAVLILIILTILEYRGPLPSPRTMQEGSTEVEATDR